MKEHYMTLIWHVIGVKSSLTVNEQQDKIVEILSLMQKDVEDFTKSSFKKKCIKAIETSLNNLN